MKTNIANENLDTVMRVRLDRETIKLLNAQAALENITMSELIRTSIKWYLHKDINYKNQLEATIESLRNEQRKTSKELDLFSSLFQFWTRYYFTLTQGLADLPDEEKRIRTTMGEKQTEVMLKSFRGELKNKKPGLIEALVADYMVQENE